MSRGGKDRSPRSSKLLNTPQRRLLRPLAVESHFLKGEFIYLCANEDQARECEREGKVAYTPDETAILKTKFETIPPDDYIKHLRAVHETKKTFPGSRVKR